MNLYSNELEERKRKYEEMHVHEDQLEFGVKVWNSGNDLIFQVVRKIDGFSLNCCFGLHQGILLHEPLENTAKLLNSMFNSSILSISHKIRKGLISK
jgi:hypothetical protein